MKQILVTFFVVLGVLFLFVLIALAWFIITDPFNIKPLLFGTTSMPRATPVQNVENTGTSASITPVSGGEWTLSAEQKQALSAMGINPNTLPTTISPELEACFVTALGEERVAEVKAGAVPSALEFFKARGCLP